MMWQQILIWYAVLGLAVHVAVMLMSRFYESKTPAAVFSSMGDNLARWAEEIEQKRNPSRLRWIKNASAKWVAHLAVAVFIVAVWPVAIAWKGRVWFGQYKETEAKKQEILNAVARLGVPLVPSVLRRK